MSAQGPAIIDLLDRMGVPFNRTPEGLLDFRRFGGTLYQRTAFAGATTGQQLLYALDEQVRRYEAEGKVTKYEGWEFLSAVLDAKGACRGIVAMDLRTMETPHLPRRRGHRLHRRPGPSSANHQLRDLHRHRAVRALPAGRALRQRRVHPGPPDRHPRRRQAPPDVRVGPRRRRPRLGAQDKNDKRAAAPIPEAERWYFLEEKYPKYGNLVPRDIATREIFKVVYEHGMGVDGQPMVYLDVTHLAARALSTSSRASSRSTRSSSATTRARSPMKIFPGMHYSMGGLWVDFNQQTNIPGLFAAGEADYSIHGANRLGANSLLSCIYGGFVAGPQALQYAKSLPEQEGDGGHAAEMQRQKEYNNVLLNNPGTENPFKIWRELGETMTKHATIIRYNAGLEEADAKIVELQQRYRNINLSDKSQWANTSFAFARQLYNMLELARVIVQGAKLRDESRGAHYKPDFPERNDEKFLKTTKASFKDGAPLSSSKTSTSATSNRGRGATTPPHKTDEEWTFLARSSSDSGYWESGVFLWMAVSGKQSGGRKLHYRLMILVTAFGLVLLFYLARQG